MARKPRIHYDGALYHVICRGNNKNYIFADNEDKEKYKELLKNYKKRYNYKIYAYCIMGNHVHILIEVAKIPLSKIMQGIQQVYTQYYNKKENRSGHVFEQRYKANLCDKDEYLFSLIRYIHQNPIRADIEEGLSYKYSSHNNYINAKSEKTVDLEYPLSLFGEKVKEQITEYKKFIEVTEENIQVLKTEELMPVIIKKEFEDMEDKKYTIDQIIEKVCKYYDVEREEVNLKIRKEKFVKARKAIIYLAKKYTDITNKKLSQILNIAESTISNIIVNDKGKRIIMEDIKL
ncbi:transposase [Clostridiaceae bacterium M8S5]|nr:transposase [Clostridiaceae bacterium M8S5]